MKLASARRRKRERFVSELAQADERERLASPCKTPDGIRIKGFPTRERELRREESAA